MFSKLTIRSKKSKKYYEISTIYEYVEKLEMIIGYNVWMICLELNWFFYDSIWMLQLSEFVWTLRFLARVVFNNFLLIDATDRIKISSDQKRLFFAVRLYPLSFFMNTPFKLKLFAKIWKWARKKNRSKYDIMPFF